MWGVESARDGGVVEGRVLVRERVRKRMGRNLGAGRRGFSRSACNASSGYHAYCHYTHLFLSVDQLEEERNETNPRRG